MKPKDVIDDGLCFGGFAFAAYGFWQLEPALAFVFAGLTLLGVGLWRTR